MMSSQAETLTTRTPRSRCRDCRCRAPTRSHSAAHDESGTHLAPKAQAIKSRHRLPLRSSTRRLIPTVTLLGPPGGAQAGAGREPDPCRSVQISVALGVSSLLCQAVIAVCGFWLVDADHRAGCCADVFDRSLWLGTVGNGGRLGPVGRFAVDCLGLVGGLGEELVDAACEVSL